MSVNYDEAGKEFQEINDIFARRDELTMRKVNHVIGRKDITDSERAALEELEAQVKRDVERLRELARSWGPIHLKDS